MNISSVFTVTEFPMGKLPKKSEIVVSGHGQEAIKFLRSMYSPFTKFILEGFEINGNFMPLVLNYYK